MKRGEKTCQQTGGSGCAESFFCALPEQRMEVLQMTIISIEKYFFVVTD